MTGPRELTEPIYLVTEVMAVLAGAVVLAYAFPPFPLWGIILVGVWAGANRHLAAARNDRRELAAQAREQAVSRHGLSVIPQRSEQGQQPTAHTWRPDAD